MKYKDEIEWFHFTWDISDWFSCMTILKSVIQSSRKLEFNNNKAWIQMMTWCRTSKKSLCESIITCWVVTYTYASSPRWHYLSTLFINVRYRHIVKQQKAAQYIFVLGWCSLGRQGIGNHCASEITLKVMANHSICQGLLVSPQPQ